MTGAGAATPKAMDKINAIFIVSLLHFLADGLLSRGGTPLGAT
jgi:hypothetical protein